MRSIGIVLLAGLLLAGCVPSSPTEAPTTGATSAPPSTAATVDASASDDITSFGTLISVDDTSVWAFTIHTPQPDGTAWVAQASADNSVPTQGNVWVAASIRVVVRDIPELAGAAGRELSPATSLVPLFITAGGTRYELANVPFPALFDGTTWEETPAVELSAGMEWDQPFALMVPTADVEGGQFAIRHEASSTLFRFDD